MQKKLIALAVAGLASSAAFAQSNVTVYGIADVYYGHATFSGLNSQNSIGTSGLSSSRLGFKGVEDLGNGLKALFTLEYGLAVDSNTGVGTGGATARQQFAGLTGAFGTVVAGRLQTAGYDFSAATNVFHGTAINALDTVSPSVLINSSARASNAVAYISPSFSGFTVAYNHARLTENSNATATTDGDNYANLLRGAYANGPLNLDLVYGQAKFKQSQDADPKSTATSPLVTTTGYSTGFTSIVGLVKAALGTTTLPADTKVSDWGFGGGYDFGVLKLKASYVQSKIEVPTVSEIKNKAWQIGAAIPVSAAGNVLVSYAKNNIDDTLANDADTKSYTVAYTHSLSKRTTLYTGWQHVTNDNGVAVTPATISGTAADKGGSGNLIVGGINHAF